MSKHRGLRLKPLREQVIVITGATSGVGLSTARAAAVRGASLVLAARNEEALKAICADLSTKGAKVVYVPADVAQPADVRAIAAVAVSRFGGFDTWINNAGVSMVGPVTETRLEDHQRLFETNYWGVVHGSLAAIEQFSSQDGGGVLINVGAAAAGDIGLPLQAAFSASKHAVKGFTNALRMELMSQRAPVSVTLIKPSAVDSPSREHARNLGGAGDQSPTGVYATPLVAQAILYAAEHRVRELAVGGGGVLLAMAAAAAPAFIEPFLAFGARHSARSARGADPNRVDSLYKAGHDLRERAFQPRVRESSLYAAAQMRPKASLSLAALAALGVALAFHIGARRGRPPAAEEG